MGKHKFIKDSCAPTEAQINEFSCYTPEVLNKMKNIWNSRHPDDKIETTDTKKIWDTLKDRFGDVCYRESCWIEKTFLKEKIPTDIINITFAPKAPKEWIRNPQEWLSSVDICRLMSLYEKRFKCFEFLGPSPIDYDTKVRGSYVWEELATFNLKRGLSKGKNKWGVIFNLDPHYKGGSHWVAAFIRMKTKEILYMDSYGMPPEKNIEKFLKNVQEQAANLGIDMRMVINETRHQYSNSECGMYSLYFVVQMLMDAPASMMKRKIPDKKMIRLRELFFNRAD